MSDEPTASPPTDAPPRVRAHEVLIFIVLGLVPITLIYTLAARGIDDLGGQRFELERQHLLAACMDALDDRAECRDQVDDQLQECYARHADDQGQVSDREALRRCVSRRPDATFSERDEATREADAKARKQRQSKR